MIPFSNSKRENIWLKGRCCFIPSDQERFAAGSSVMREMFGTRADQVVESGADSPARWMTWSGAIASATYGNVAALLEIAQPVDVGYSRHLQWSQRNSRGMSPAQSRMASKEEVREVLIHTMIYAGVPVGGKHARSGGGPQRTRTRMTARPREEDDAYRIHRNWQYGFAHGRQSGQEGF
jgi:hypothetical protein